MTATLEPQSAAAPRSTGLSRRAKSVAFVANLCFFVYLSYWCYDNIHYDDFMQQLRQIPLRAVVTAMAINLLVLASFSLRLSAIVRQPPLSCFLITNIGFTFNGLIPFRAGEAIKVYFASVYFGYAIAQFGAAIVMEKLYDASALFSLSALVAITTDLKIIDIGGPTRAALAALLVFCGVGIISMKRNNPFFRLSEWKIVQAAQLEGFAKQAEALFSSQNVSRVALFTALIWAMNICLVFVLFRMLLPEIAFGFLDALSLLLIAALAIAVPASPAGLGVFEAGIVSYLTTICGVQNERAVSTALAYHFCITAPHTIIVALFFGVTLLRLLNAKVMS